ncbi:MAG: DNA alkylation repair protein [Sulfurimonas sp.]|nr:MAG: DNA alkylation repair protein [Sulfurimonas sp.]
MAKLRKDLYNHQYILTLSKAIKKIYMDFESIKFQECVFNEYWLKKELKQRMRHISKSMYIYLPKDYEISINILINVFKNMPHNLRIENMIFQDFVEVFGLNDFDISMQALEKFTINCSSEFAIRQFILKNKEKTMSQMFKWSKSSNEHHRRLASEGCRPRLPWAIALNDFKKDPSLVLEILDTLKDDKSAYVRKSVANNLNDISKDNPDILKFLLKKWIGNNKTTDALLKHASRTLLKASDRDVLNIFGFFRTKDIQIKNFNINTKIEWGGELNFSFDIFSNEKLGRLRIEYIMYFLRQNSKYSKKVFKISEGNYETNFKSISKKHSFRAISTRKYYDGIQKITILINGKEFVNSEFVLHSRNR